jgi:hypothetical protein
VPNFYLDNSDILFHMKTMDLSRIIRFREGDFSESRDYPYAPKDAAEARENYGHVLEIVGQIAGEFIAPRAEEVDREGAHFEDGQVTYAKGTKEALDRLAKADLMGFTLPRRYGGINMPKTIYSLATEIISRADASLMNLFGLQEIADTICKFGSEEQKQRYLPKFCSGETSGAMALTEPDAGSDLQSVRLRAHQGEDGKWHLNGVKRFITNGCADISLVMARSEPGTSGGRGISLFIYEKDEHLKIRRIEDKLGIHGSPTCELQFTNAPAELLGKRKMGLIRYTMSLMNGARLGVAAQAVGIAEAAYHESYRYACERIQFKRQIRDFEAVYEMLTDMRVSIEAGRSFLMETSRIVDLKENLEEYLEANPEQKENFKDELKRYTRYASLFTPALKAYTTEMANQVCYDAIQVHGGTGYTRDFAVERHYRDARITNIYEGTTQLQVVAAIGGIQTGVVFERLNEYEDAFDLASLGTLFEQAQQCRTHLESVVSHIKERGEGDYHDFHARRVLEMANDTIIAYLLLIDGLQSERKAKLAGVFLSKALPRVKASFETIMSDDRRLIDSYRDIIDRPA